MVTTATFEPVLTRTVHLPDTDKAMLRDRDAVTPR